MIHVQMPAEDPIHAAIARHRAAYDAFQVAPEGTPSVEANDEYDAASDALVSTACATRFGALALLTHLRWWLADEAEFKAGHQPAYGLAEARAADLTLFLGTPLSPAMRPNGDVLAGFLPQAAPAGCLGRALPACDRRRHGAARAAPSEPLPGEGAEAALIVSARPDTAHVRAPRLLTLSGEILASFLLSRDKTVLPECGRSGRRLRSECRHVARSGWQDGGRRMVSRPEQFGGNVIPCRWRGSDPVASRSVTKAAS